MTTEMSGLSGVGGPPGFMMIHELDSLTMQGFFVQDDGAGQDTRVKVTGSRHPANGDEQRYKNTFAGRREIGEVDTWRRFCDGLSPLNRQYATVLADHFTGTSRFSSSNQLATMWIRGDVGGLS